MRIGFAVFALFCAALPAAAREDILIADFEGADYGAWKVEGEAFGPGPAQGTLKGQMNVSGFEGKGLVNSFFNGDGTTGSLTSPSFTIERPFINFLIGGGKIPGQTELQLVVDGKPVRTATGPNDAPGGSENLQWSYWDVSDLQGKPAVIRIVDTATGGWGHINVDQIAQSDKKAPMPVEKTREMTLEKKYLLIPVKTGAPKAWMSVEIDGEPVRAFEVELAAEPEFWAFLDITAFHGKKAVLRADGVLEDSTALDAVDQGDAIKGAENLYKEPLRPQFHFTARRGWNNDPNGLVYHDGEYHLFFQHNPYGWNWGNMHWGHAVSRDLVHWEERPEALYPDKFGTMFSGSAVVDHNNSAGFDKGKDEAICLFYTAAGGADRTSKGQPFTQCMAYSTDRGRTWTKYDGNPVVKNYADGNRDPKVIWHEPTQKWVMALYLIEDDYALFESKDLKNWEKMSEVQIPGTSECPEIFELPLDGDRNNTRWVFYGGNCGYVVGKFDGTKFETESGPYSIHHGNCFYASQTYNNIPAEDGRRILVAWGQMNFPGMPFNQMMTFPVELTLHTTPDGPRLFVLPAREIESLYKATRTEKDKIVKPEQALEIAGSELMDLLLTVDPGTATGLAFNVRGVPIEYDAQKKELKCGDKVGPLAPVDGVLRLRMLVDRGSIEIYANDGQLYMPMGVIVPEKARNITISASGGEARVTECVVHELTSAWNVK